VYLKSPSLNLVATTISGGIEDSNSNVLTVNFDSPVFIGVDFITEDMISVSVSGSNGPYDIVYSWQIITNKDGTQYLQLTYTTYFSTSKIEPEVFFLYLF